MQEVVHKRFIYLYPLSVQVYISQIKNLFSKSGMRAQQSLETRRKMFCVCHLETAHQKMSSLTINYYCDFCDMLSIATTYIAIYQLFKL